MAPLAGAATHSVSAGSIRLVTTRPRLYYDKTRIGLLRPKLKSRLVGKWSRPLGFANQLLNAELVPESAAEQDLGRDGGGERWRVCG